MKFCYGGGESSRPSKRPETVINNRQTMMRFPPSIVVSIADTSPTFTFPLLRLPAELRIKVYENVSERSSIARIVNPDLTVVRITKSSSNSPNLQKMLERRFLTVLPHNSLALVQRHYVGFASPLNPTALDNLTHIIFDSCIWWDHNEHIPFENLRSLDVVEFGPSATLNLETVRTVPTSG